jgi:DNA-binding response OmpR family regulator
MARAKSPKKPGALVLVVEDEPALREMYKAWLLSAGYRVVTADNGVAAVYMTLHERPDLVLLDILLPKKDGFEVLGELRRNPKTKALPVIILSSLDQDFEQRQGLNLGAERFLVKTSISPEILFDTVREVLP